MSFDSAALNAWDPAAAMLPVLAASTEMPLSDIGLYELRDSVRPVRLATPCSAGNDGCVGIPPTRFAEAPVFVCTAGLPTPAVRSCDTVSPARPGSRSAIAWVINPADTGMSDDALIAVAAAAARPS